MREVVGGPQPADVLAEGRPGSTPRESVLREAAEKYRSLMFEGSSKLAAFHPAHHTAMVLGRAVHVSCFQLCILLKTIGASRLKVFHM